VTTSGCEGCGRPLEGFSESESKRFSEGYKPNRGAGGSQDHGFKANRPRGRCENPAAATSAAALELAGATAAGYNSFRGREFAFGDA